MFVYKHTITPDASVAVVPPWCVIIPLALLVKAFVLKICSDLYFMWHHARFRSRFKCDSKLCSCCCNKLTNQTTIVSFSISDSVTCCPSLDYSVRQNFTWSCFKSVPVICRFYIILRGSVSILHKDSLEDVDLGEEADQRQIDRSTLGNKLVTLGKELEKHKLV